MTSGYQDPSAQDPQSDRQDAHEHAGHMRTLLHQFSREFETRFRPLLPALQDATDTLAQGADQQAGVILPPLRDLRHQFQVLMHKVAEHQAYVLIFGPLKSGKSTFMNAICSAYVSEVTSLPAYPCIVTVAHNDEPEYVLTRYDGQSEILRDRHGLHDFIAEAHRELTRQIRHVEGQGQAFDPAVHMPQAIRKIEVRIPTPALAQSGAVLVDTPGLYTKMKFGYDRMTREFRNVAACAIFIVKTDNLFLEQVFQEFHELLELFSRVFLIVNVDAAKKDLRPDGTLGPSLEHDAPEQIVDAFRTLSMSTPLKEAADAGRLEIYPIDVLGAASRRIREGRLGEDADLEPEGEHPGRQLQFDRLMDDLTEYLNSSEYLRAFMVDSLRRASSLLDELGDLVEHSAVRSLQSKLDEMQHARQEASSKIDASRRLGQIDWQEGGKALLVPMVQRAATLADKIRQTSRRRLEETIGEWFAGDESLQDLNTGRIEPILRDARVQLAEALGGDLQAQAPRATQAVTDDPVVGSDIREAGLDVPAIVQESTRAATDVAPAMVSSRLVADLLPVKRRFFWDWVLLRRLQAVRRGIFGPPSSPARPVEAAVKSRQLGPPAREEMERIVQGQLDELLDASAGELPEQMVHRHASALAGGVQAQLSAIEERTRIRIDSLDGDIRRARRILDALHMLADEVERRVADVRELSDRYAQAHAAPGVHAAEPPEADQEVFLLEPIELDAPAHPEASDEPDLGDVDAEASQPVERPRRPAAGPEQMRWRP